MTTYFTAPVRTLLLAAALAFAAQTATAGPTAADPPQTTARSTARSEDKAASAPDGVSVDGVLIIVGIVGVVIVLAWVCSRFSDSR